MNGSPSTRNQIQAGPDLRSITTPDVPNPDFSRFRSTNATADHGRNSRFDIAASSVRCGFNTGMPRMINEENHIPRAIKTPVIIAANSKSIAFHLENTSCSTSSKVGTQHNAGKVSSKSARIRILCPASSFIDFQRTTGTTIDSMVSKASMDVLLISSFR